MSEQNTEQSPEETEAHRMRQGQADAEGAEGADVEAHRMRQGQADAEGDDDVEGHLRTPGGRG